MSNKEFINYNQQIQVIYKKKLKIRNRKQAKQSLIDYGLYNIINTYKDPFLEPGSPRKDERYYLNTFFEEIVTLYHADMLLRHSFQKPLANIENKLKAAVAFEISKKYGKNHNHYLSIDTFYTDDTQSLIRAQKLIAELVKKIANKTDDKYVNSIAHYNKKYKFVPLWVLMTSLTFGEVSLIYSCLKDSDKAAISRRFNLPPNDLGSILRFINIIRNKCAHHNRLYCHKADTNGKFPIPDLPIHALLEIKKKKHRYVNGKDDMLACLLVFKYFMTPREYKRLIKIIMVFTRYITHFISPKAAHYIISTTGLHTNILKKLKNARP